MNSNKTKDDLSARELNSVSGGTLEYELTCRYCYKTSTSDRVNTRMEGTNCWNQTMRWQCPYCSQWQ